MKKFLITILAAMSLGAAMSEAQERIPEYLQAEKFTQSKLSTMLFSTTVDPHWFQ